MKKHGFTLAEVLITLVIIGIIAAMTIPTLMNKTNEQETVVAVKKAYSTLSQAYQRLVAENGEIYPENLGATQQEATVTLGGMFAKQLNVQKNCGVSADDDCWSTQNGGMYKKFDGSDWYNFNTASNLYKIRLADGSSIAIVNNGEYVARGDSEELKFCFGYFNFDVNGDKGPNMLGKDVFAFWITKYGVFPMGMPNDTYDYSTFSTCKTTGGGCTAWVITKGNMDYLRKDVSW